MENCSHLLEESLRRAMSRLDRAFIKEANLAARVQSVALCPSNRAGVRLLLACILAKLHRPEVDPRKPYSEIGSKDCFSGRPYDEQVLGDFISRNNLPC